MRVQVCMHPCVLCVCALTPECTGVGGSVPEVNLGPRFLDEVSHGDLDLDKRGRLAGQQSQEPACQPLTIATYFYMDSGVELRSSTSRAKQELN